MARNRRGVLVLVAVLAVTPAWVAAAVVDLPADIAFQRASQVLLDSGALPTFRDRELLAIKTDPVEVRLTPEQADCGKMFGIPYLKDKRTKTAATYQVLVKPIDPQSSDVTVKVQLDGYMDVNEGAPFFIEKTRDKNKVLTCRSTGWLEGQFVQKLIEQAGHPDNPSPP